VKNLIEQNRINEAYLLVCNGADIDQEDYTFLKYTVEGYDCINDNGIKRGLIRVGEFNGENDGENEVSG
jgi:hypothetical protein